MHCTASWLLTAALLLISSVAPLAAADRLPRASVQELVECVRRARRGAWEHRVEAANRLEALLRGREQQFGLMLNLYIAYGRADDAKEAIRLLEVAIKGGVDLPECIDLWASRKYGIPAKSRPYTMEIGRILPFSKMGRSRDRRDVILSFVPSGRDTLSIPAGFGDRPKLLEIGRLYEEMGLWREAIDTYIIYLYFAVPRPADVMRGESVLLRVATLEERMGERDLAIRACLKAACYLDSRIAEENLRRVPQRLSYCLSKGELKRADLAEPRLDLAKVERICRLYAGLNMHPLVLSLLVKVEAATGADLSKLKAQTTQDWRALVGKCMEIFGKKLLVYGHRPEDVKDWSTAKIIRPRDIVWKPRSDAYTLEWYIAGIKARNKAKPQGK